MGNRFMPAVVHSFGRKPRRFQATFVLFGTGSPTILFPSSIVAAGFARAERMAAGKYEFELSDVWPTVLNTAVGANVPAVYAYGIAYGPGTSDTNDMNAQARVSISGTTGRLVITALLKTGATNTDPPDLGAGGANLAVWIEVESAP